MTSPSQSKYLEAGVPRPLDHNPISEPLVLGWGVPNGHTLQLEGFPFVQGAGLGLLDDLQARHG